MRLNYFNVSVWLFMLSCILPSCKKDKNTSLAGLYLVTYTCIKIPSTASAQPDTITNRVIGKITYVSERTDHNWEITGLPKTRFAEMGESELIILGDPFSFQDGYDKWTGKWSSGKDTLFINRDYNRLHEIEQLSSVWIKLIQTGSN